MVIGELIWWSHQGAFSFSEGGSRRRKASRFTNKMSELEILGGIHHDRKREVVLVKVGGGGLTGRLLRKESQGEVRFKTIVVLEYSE